MSGPEPSRDKDNFVLYVPEIKHHRFRVTEAGRVVLEFEINPLKKLMGRLARRRPVSEIQLDELASTAWLSMDGVRSLLEVARIQSGTTGDDLDESVRRVVKFTHYIARRGWIRFKRVASS